MYLSYLEDTVVFRRVWSHEAKLPWNYLSWITWWRLFQKRVVYTIKYLHLHYKHWVDIPLWYHSSMVSPG